MKYSTPSNKKLGKLYAEKLLGAIFSISSLPKKPDSRDEYFDKNSLQVSSVKTGNLFSPMANFMNSTSSLQSDSGVIFKNLWIGLENLATRLHRIILSFLKCAPEVRNDLLVWFGECIENNTSRKQVWSNMMSQLLPMEHTHIPDGFALNLCTVLLRLCEPFIKPANNPRLLKIDPTYCSVVRI